MEIIETLGQVKAEKLTVALVKRTAARLGDDSDGVSLVIGRTPTGERFCVAVGIGEATAVHFEAWIRRGITSGDIEEVHIA